MSVITDLLFGADAVDLFAGWGGFTLAAEQAGVRVRWAANHWPLAVQAHKLNHPNTEHVCQDLRQADWTALPRFDLLLASPACQGHSQASQPKRRLYHDAMRATAWAVVDCCEVTRPRGFLVENVVDFRRWELYPEWCSALEKLGYHLTELQVTASLHGVPQRRKRLFFAGTRAAHRDAFQHLADASRQHLREPAFGPCIEWGAPARWRCVATAPPEVQKRIATAQRNYGPKVLTQHVTGHPGVPLHEPIRTITTKDQWAVVNGAHYRSLTIRENARAMGFPDDYVWPISTRREQVTGLGNAVSPPPARALIKRLAEVCL